MQTRSLGPFQVSAIGLGCMNLSHGYGRRPEEADAARLLLRALDLGVTHFDTAAVYGLGHNEQLIGRILAPHRARFTLASKGGLGRVQEADGTVRRVIDNRPEALRRDCEASLKRLNTDVIDLYYLHRWDKTVPIEDCVGALSALVREGKIRAIGLSEVSAPTLRRAHAVHPVTAVQAEYSLWTRNPEIAVLQACRELGVALVAFSPVGRGFLAAALSDPTQVGALDASDLRRNMPRFQGENFNTNLKLLARYQALAREAGCTPGQLALAWLLNKHDHVFPIPGTTRIAHLEENVGAAAIKLDEALIARVEEVVNQQTVAGARYPKSMADVDTEEF